MSSPTQRSKARLIQEGYTVGITEHWNPHAFIRQDLFGFIDMIAIRGAETLAVQTTSGSNASARVKKIRESEEATEWLKGWPERSIVVHSWAKRGAKGKRKQWDLVVIPILPEDVEKDLTSSDLKPHHD